MIKATTKSKLSGCNHLIFPTQSEIQTYENIYTHPCRPHRCVLFDWLRSPHAYHARQLPTQPAGGEVMSDTPDIIDQMDEGELRAELRKLALAAPELTRLRAFLHAHRMHPDYEYETTTGGRKCFDEAPPEGEGWERNMEQGRDGWERFAYHEEAYWRRLKPSSANTKMTHEHKT